MTIPTVDLENGTTVPAQNADIRVVPMGSGRLLILSVAGEEHAIRLGADAAESLAKLLSERGGRA